jgi:hypothetical protein
VVLSGINAWGPAMEIAVRRTGIVDLPRVIAKRAASPSLELAWLEARPCLFSTRRLEVFALCSFRMRFLLTKTSEYVQSGKASRK